MYIKDISNQSSRIVYKGLSKLVTTSSHTVLNEETDKVDIGELVPVEASEEYGEENGNPKENAKYQPLADEKIGQNGQQEDVAQKLNAAMSIADNSAVTERINKVDFSV